MDDGVSVFHKGVRVPPTVNDFNLIPKRHLDWYKDTFLNNHRSIPPLPDSVAPVGLPKQFITVKGNATIDVIQKASYSETIFFVCSFLGINYVISKTHAYVGERAAMPLGSHRQALACTALDGTPIVAKLQGTTIQFFDMHRNSLVGSVSGVGMFARNNAIYSVGNGKMTENTFLSLGSKLIHQQKSLENVSLFTSSVFDGCVLQDLLGRKYLTLPYEKGKSFSKYVSNLDGHRIIEAKSDKTVTVVLTEKGGKYYRFIIQFAKNYETFDVREIPDVAYDTINFAVNESGICLLLASPTELELFSYGSQIQVINDPPFDSSMKLFNTPDGFFFINNNSIHQIKKK
jgi:hypothetical protein